MAITKVTSGLISADASSIDLNIDAGTLYLDVSENKVGISTTSPTQKLDINSGYLNFSNNYGIRWGGATSVALYGNQTSNFLGFQTSSSEKMRIDSSGFVGIGTSSPSALLHLSGADPIVKFTDTAGGDTFGIFASADNFLGFYNFTDSRTDLIIDGSGNVGIGTSSPSNYYSGADNLVVSQASGEAGISVVTANNTSGALYFADGTTGSQKYAGGLAYNHSTDVLSLVSAGATKAVIDSSGSLLVNTTSAGSNRLKIVGDASRYGILSENLSGYGAFNLKSTTVAQTWSIGAVDNSSNSDLFIYGGSSAGTKVTLDSSGNVGIGQTSPYSHASFSSLSLGGTSSKGGLIQLKHSDDSAKGYLYAQGDAATLESVSTNILRFVTNGAERARINTDGQFMVNTTANTGPAEICVKSTQTGRGCLGLHNTNSGGSFVRFANTANNAVIGVIQNNNDNSTSYLTTSDYRLKENVVEMTGALDRINQLQPKRFNFIADETNTLVDGFLAHEVSDIVPEAISGEKDAVDDEGNPEYQGIDHSKLVPLLTKAIQEQQTIIDNLTTRIETLENA